MSEAMEKAYEAIRERIVRGIYAPGARLKERRICEELDVSRTPVREALRLLAAEGLVAIEPRRGAVVAELSAEEAREIYSLGAVLESFAARLAAGRASADDLAGLTSLLTRMEAALDRGGSDGRADYLALDAAFHGEILRIAGNRRLTAVMQQIVRMPVLIQAFQRYSDEDLRQSLNQHRGIHAALAAGDAEWAETAMRAHILGARSIRLPGVAP